MTFNLKILHLVFSLNETARRNLDVMKDKRNFAPKKRSEKSTQRSITLCFRDVNVKEREREREMRTRRKLQEKDMKGIVWFISMSRTTEFLRLHQFSALQGLSKFVRSLLLESCV